ncbi:M16 family metallopeptidase [Cyanobacterium aponinum]|uniref:Peptidase M16 domain protein n=1 Tax=Cyanobacterium aponinum (strain PCC 10605) TaxID=755178 RepID=K9Z641_CYAAP|nr:pitrilysin family protein [Cyanobacterium aponinum]AFZ53868.1 peptidase M16 domain protein [Cyanobacterium aponinum PCC 10605]PHV63012.1 insulinase family protein [Cyanobacterium aponinum IPPAS B-1201]
MIKKLGKIWQWLGFTFITIAIVITTHHVAFADVTPSTYRDLQFPPLAEIKLPEYERYQLDNGMVIYLIEDHRLPLISGNAVIRTGSRFDPPSQVGLAELTGSLIRLGGTANYSPEQLNSILEQKAAAIESSIDETMGSVSFSSLSYDLDTIFPLFAEVIQSPAFDSQQLEVLKTQAKGAIARRNDDPGNIASREFKKLVYGENNPYARTIEYNTLDNIQQSDIKNFHSKYVRPEGIILGIVGDFDSSQIKEKIAQYFGNWQGNSQVKPTFDTITSKQEKSKGIFIADQPQLTQSNILLGHLAGKLNDPNYPTLSVMNGVLNGFGGRLHNEIRSRQGLAYSVYGIWQGAYDYPGLFVAGGQTKTDTTTQFIKTMKEEIEKLRTQPITEAELNYAKDSILNSFVFKFQNPSQTLSRMMTYEYYDYPQNFIFDYQQGVKNTQIDDVLNVAQEYLHPDKIVTLVVGNEEEIKQELQTLGQNIKQIEIE